MYIFHVGKSKPTKIQFLRHSVNLICRINLAILNLSGFIGFLGSGDDFLNEFETVGLGLFGAFFTCELLEVFLVHHQHCLHNGNHLAFLLHLLSRIGFELSFFGQRICKQVQSDLIVDDGVIGKARFFS